MPVDATGNWVERNAPLVVLLRDSGDPFIAPALANLAAMRCKNVMLHSSIFTTDSPWALRTAKPALVTALQNAGFGLATHIEFPAGTTGAIVDQYIALAKAWGTWGGCMADAAERYTDPTQPNQALREQAYLDKVNAAFRGPAFIQTSTSNVRPGSYSHNSPADWKAGGFADKQAEAMIQRAEAFTAWVRKFASTQWQFGCIGWITEMDAGTIDASLYRCIMAAAVRLRATTILYTQTSRLAAGGDVLACCAP